MASKYLIDCVVLLAVAGLYIMAIVRTQYLYQQVSEKHNYTANSSTKYCAPNDNVSSAEEKVVADEVSKLSQYIDIAGSVPCIVSSTFLTAWSDRVGRKIPLMICLSGFVINCSLQVIIIYLRWPLYTLIINAVILSICGSFPALLNISMAHLSDITKQEEKSMRYTLLECMLGLGGGLAAIGTGFWIKKQGFIPTSFFAAACTVAGMLIIPFLTTRSQNDCAIACSDEDTQNQVNDNMATKECDYGTNIPSVKTEPKEKVRHRIPDLSLSSRMRTIWRIYTTEYSHCDVCKIDEKKQTCCHGGGVHKGRVWTMWMYLLAFNFYVYVVFGVASFTNIYLLAFPLCFSPVLLGIFSGLKLGSFVVSPLLVKMNQVHLHWSNQTLIVLAMFISIISTLTYGFAQSAVIVFVACAISIFTNVTSPLLRSQISSLVSDSEQGSSLSLLSGLESIINLLGTVTYLFIYPATLYIYHGFTWMYSVVVLCIPLALMSVVWIKEKRTQDACSLSESSPLLGGS